MSAEGSIRWFPVGEVGEVRMGKQLSPASRANGIQLPYLRVANVYEGHITYADVNSMGFSIMEKEVYKLLPGDVLLNEGQENLGMVGRSAIYDGPPGEYRFQNTLIRFRPGPDVLPEYAQTVFVHWRRHGVFARIAEKTSISHLGGSRFAKILFPLRGRGDQRRIVEVLAAFANEEQAIESSIAKLRLVRAGLVQSLDSYEQCTLESVITRGPQNGIYKSVSSYGLTGTPIVRINSFDGGPSGLVDDLLRVDASSAEILKYGLSAGDLLVNRVNTVDLVGKSTVVTGLTEETIFESNIMRCSLDRERVLPMLIEAWMSGASVKRHFLKRAKSAVSQASLNQDDVLSCPLPEISISAQENFLAGLRRIDSQIRAGKLELKKLGEIRRGLTDDLLSGKVRLRDVA